MRRFWMTVLVLATTGCGDIDLEQLVRQHPALTRIQVEPPGAHCEHGGQAVHSGLDLDDDGTLSDEEVKRTEFLCAAAPRPILVDTRTVAPGLTCPLGGAVLRAGLDTDGDGVLSDLETARELTSCRKAEDVRYRLTALDTTSSACAPWGTRVEAGPDLDGDGLLGDGELRTETVICVRSDLARVRLQAEPGGARCPAGGTRVDVGTDADADGIFEDGEVTARTFVCQPLHTYVGDYHVRDATDLVLLQSLSHIQGALRIHATALTEVVAPSLMVVQGELSLQANEALTRVELPGLRFVAGDVNLLQNGKLETLVLGDAPLGPLWVGGSLWLYASDSLTTLAGLNGVIPRGDLQVEDNALLEDGGAFTRITALPGDLRFMGNPRLASLPLPQLRSVGGTVSITRNDALTSLSGTRLEEVGAHVVIAGNAGLTDLTGMPELGRVHGTLSIFENPRLTTTRGLSGLRRVGGLEFARNDALEEVGEGLSALEAVSGELRFQENAALTHLGRFAFLSTVEGLELVSNPLLTDVSGLERVTELRFLVVQTHERLQGLEGLGHLRSLWTLNIRGNTGLTHLGLEGLQTVTDNFYITHNRALPTCLARELATRVYTALAPDLEGNDDAATCPPPPPPDSSP
ncbi:hypothetical protein LY474_23115 [Myxococcus stipitatus]|uniref:DUF7151 family protein n=1 Tax=Myxococcus stipitatus TaxID=83455 RepID=UPI001F1F74BB|nr:hypothetical protein [Myxococcus stipitatus]MCE9670702.1 hypothetical protein [Myxococcus stipitatus]